MYAHVFRRVSVAVPALGCEGSRLQVLFWLHLPCLSALPEVRPAAEVTLPYPTELTPETLVESEGLSREADRLTCFARRPLFYSLD